MTANKRQRGGAGKDDLDCREPWGSGLGSSLIIWVTLATSLPHWPSVRRLGSAGCPEVWLSGALLQGLTARPQGTLVSCPPLDSGET